MTAESRQIRQKTLLLPIFTPKMANIDKKTVVAGSSSKCYDYQTAKQAGHVSSDQERARCQQLRLAIVAGFCGWIHGLHQPCSQNPDLGTFPVTDSTGIAQDKKASKAAMATAAQTIASAVHAYAVKNKNNTLANETDFTISDLTGERDADAIKDCQNIHDLANTNLASLGAYGITAAKLTALQAVIDGYKAIVTKPRDNIVAGATVTQALSDEFDAADETLSEILDGLIGQFQATNAKFVSDYNNARIIVDTSASHASPPPPTPPPATPHP